MTTLIIPPRLAIHTLPGGPHEIPPDASLEMLQQIKLGWIEHARVQAFPESMWQVVSWLGSPERTLRGPCRLWQPDAHFALLGFEESVQYIPARGTCLLNRTVTAWCGAPGADKNPVDAVVLHANLVSRWQWQVIGDEIRERKEHLLFFPGDWISHVLDASTEATVVAGAQRSEVDETHRRQLLEELLAGKSV